MKVFKEKQFLNRWWLLMFIMAIIVILVGTAYYATADAEEDTAVVVSLISVAITLPITLGLLYLCLETTIDQNGLTTWFKPFGFTKKSFSWDEISECYIRLYDSSEFGGWGWRGLWSDRKAYTIYGNKGIQILTRDGKEILVGTQRPAAAKSSIKRFFKSNSALIHEN